MGAWSGSLRVRLLGGLTVDGRDAHEVGSRKARTLLKVLAVARGSPVPVGLLVDALWGDDAPARPGEQIGVLVSRLRKVLGTDRIVRSESGYALRTDWLDIDALAALVDEAAAALREGRSGASGAAASAALALARGELLPDDEGVWVEGERARTGAMVGRARGLAAEAALQAGDVVAAEIAAQSALAADPYDEVALRVLMAAQAGGGRPASALASYSRTRMRLLDDLGVSPSDETESLHAAVLQGTFVAMASGRPAVTRLVGREAELDALGAHLLAARTRARVVALVGEPGIGKTTLLQHFAERARASGARVLACRTDELGRDLPLQPIVDALRADGASIAIDMPPARDLAATNMPDAVVDQERQFTVVLAALVRGGAPTVLVVDDVQWADAATRAWTAWVAGRPGSLLVALAARPGAGVIAAHELPLGPLDDVAVGALVAQAGVPSRQADVRARSGGNPLFALALAEAPDGELPLSVQQAFTRTAAELEGGAAEVARAGAVLGGDLDVDLLADVLHLSAVVVIERLEVATAAGLLIERGAGFAFRHALVREALASSVGAARAALLHREVARVLDARTLRDPLAVAVHAALGGAAEVAARSYEDAAALAFGRADVVAAEQHLRASIAAVDTASARRALARVLMVERRLDDAAGEAARAVALDGAPETLEVAGWIEYYRRRYDRAQGFADEAVARSAPGSALRASALTLAGRVRHGTGDVTGAAARLVTALDAPHEVRGVAEVWLGQVRVHEGRPTEALELLDHALLDPDHLAHPFAPVHGRFARVMALGQRGRVTDALRACDELRVAIERAGAVGARFPATELNVRAWVLRATGGHPEADECNRRAIELNGASDGSGPSSESLAEAYWVGWLDLVDGQLARGNVAQAEVLLAPLDALDAWDGTMAWHQRHRLGLQRSRVALEAGDRARAAELAQHVRLDARARSSARYEALAHAQLVVADGDGDMARVMRTLDTLRGCAAFELPRLLDALGRAFRNDEWQREATERRGALSSEGSRS